LAGRTFTAPRTQPAADLSSMDGYAVRGDDLSGPWQVVGESAAGHPWPGFWPRDSFAHRHRGDGSARRGAVIIQEDCAREGILSP
jgi:molybdopterin molybdotransferase